MLAFSHCAVSEPVDDFDDGSSGRGGATSSPTTGGSVATGTGGSVKSSDGGRDSDGGSATTGGRSATGGRSSASSGGRSARGGSTSSSKGGATGSQGKGGAAGSIVTARGGSNTGRGGGTFGGRSGRGGGTGACDFDAATCASKQCGAACPANMGTYCETACQAIIDCVEKNSTCSTAADPLCVERNNGAPNKGTTEWEAASGGSTPPGAPAKAAQDLYECACGT